MPNKLIESKSLYLRKHAHNPIDWWYWCDEALEKAVSEDKPIFLSIGYSSCHWCTVMEGEAFSDSETAKYMNENFIPIKVDREERPDIDSVYMQALQVMTGQGGWPLNIFLTPGDLVPFFGGTYFPVEPRMGKPAFLQVLQSVRNFYDNEKEKLINFKSEIMDILKKSESLESLESTELTGQLLFSGIERALEVIIPADEQKGEPRFPMIPHASLVLRGTRLSPEMATEMKKAAYERGISLVTGGIFDHVGGGFHRYTVDANWDIPHFEKMLYDNGLIIEYLSNLWSYGMHDPAFKRAVNFTVDWLRREMTSSGGYFFSSQDADSFVTSRDDEPVEGAFYTWRYSDLKKHLSENELSTFGEYFEITPEGNLDGTNVLRRKEAGAMPEVIDTILVSLFTRRYGRTFSPDEVFPPAENNSNAKSGNWEGRIPPVTDTKLIVSWNGLMISGLVRAYQVFKKDHYAEMAIHAARFIMENQVYEDRLHRLNYDGHAATHAKSDDYAYFIRALLDIHNMDPGNTLWLDRARSLQVEFDDLFWNEKDGGYYSSPSDASSDILLRERDYMDQATPSANGIAVSNLVRLGLLTSEGWFFDRAEHLLQAFSPVLGRVPHASASLLEGLDWFIHGGSVATDKNTISILQAEYYPATVFIVDQDLQNGIAGHVCRGQTCLQPANSIDTLVLQMRDHGK